MRFGVEQAVDEHLLQRAPHQASASPALSNLKASMLSLSRTFTPSSHSITNKPRWCQLDVDPGNVDARHARLRVELGPRL